MILLTARQRLRHLWIRSRWRTWGVPFFVHSHVVFSVSHCFAVSGLQVMLAPLLMDLLAALTLFLSHLEYRR